MEGIYSAGTVHLPVLALRGIVAMPGSTLHFEVARQKSAKAVEEAMAGDRTIFLVAQREITNGEPEPEFLYETGTVAKVKQVLKIQNNAVKVMVEGISRGKVTEILNTEPYIDAMIEIFEDTAEGIDEKDKEAMIRQAQDAFDNYSEFVPKLPSEVLIKVLSEKSAGALADFLVDNIPVKYDVKQSVLDIFDQLKRLEKTIVILNEEMELLSLEREIGIRVREQIDKGQREYYLREQVKAIQSELGDGDSVTDQADEFAEQILSFSLPPELETKLLKEVDRFEKMPTASQESSVIRTYIETCLELPWNKKTNEKIDIVKAETILEKDHYGLKPIKERIIEFLAVKQMTNSLSGQILCLVGPPGVGKTSIASSIARATGRKFARVSLGGVRDEAEIRGHRKTYVGSMPGRIINAIKTAGTNNPVILLDEIDKLGNDYKGDPASALLEVLDPEQNKSFRDHYIELPFDLSDVFFITTANTADSIPKPLLDRMEILYLTSYTNNEKAEIAKRYLLPKQMKKHGLNKSKLKVDNSVIDIIIESYTRESGVRELERSIAKICRKSVRLILLGKKSVKITAENLESFLGAVKFKPEELNSKGEAGIATGLAYTSVGGEVLIIEVNVMDGTGKTELTGNLGDVMKESAKAAISFIRSNCEQYGIQPDFHKTKDIHIHVPEGAVPKDGPSAGITMATAIISALTGNPVRNDIAMTGEITLRGRVLPIGGLKEKTMAAYKMGIKTVIIPEKNYSDLEEIDETVRNGLQFIPVSNMSEVVKNAITDKKIPIDKIISPISLNETSEYVSKSISQ